MTEIPKETRKTEPMYSEALADLIGVEYARVARMVEDDIRIAVEIFKRAWIA